MSLIPRLILIDKPAGLTSFQALYPLKRELGTKKVGHCGTLDKFASGLLIICAGKATSFVPAFTGMDKEYLADVRFGAETDTLDPEGAIVGTGPLPSRSSVEAALPKFLGVSLQVPPVFSALHVDGKRAYKLARAGKVPEMEARSIHIHEIDIVSYDGESGTARIRVVCSKGTYIRSLARDLGLACGSRAYLVGLRRTKIGAFNVDDAVAPDEFVAGIHAVDGMDLAAAVPGAAGIEIDASEARSLLTGRLDKATAAKFDARIAADPATAELLPILAGVCVGSFSPPPTGHTASATVGATGRTIEYRTNWILAADELGRLL